MTTGIDRNTGRVLSGWAHVEQSLFYLFTLVFGARLMRRTVGSAVPVILGRENLTPAAMVKFYAAIILACESWEPRFRLVQVIYPTDLNSTNKLRAGQIGIRLIGEYRPNALLGDFTVAPIGGQRDFYL